MRYTHVHLLPWHWFWRTHTNDGTGIVIKWRGPFVFVKLNENIWPETSTVENVTAYRRNVGDRLTVEIFSGPVLSRLPRLRFHP